MPQDAFGFFLYLGGKIFKRLILPEDRVGDELAMPFE